jgi:hypothetical protein
MKRIFLAIGVVATAFLIGCGGGGGTSPSAPSNPGGPGAPTAPPGGGGSTPTPGPTPTPSQSQNPASTVVTIGSPGAITKSQVNTLANGVTQVISTVGRITATQNGTPMATGAPINVSVTSSDKSGTTCLIYVANGASTGTACTYPAVNSTPPPVTIAHVGDGVAVQYNDGPSAPGGTFSINGNAPGASQQPAAVTMSNPAVGIGHTANNAGILPWGGGVAYANGEIYYTQNNAINPIGMVSYANGVAGTSVANMVAAGMSNAPAGGLVIGPDGNLWGTEQNASKVFEVAPAGGLVTEYAITCTGGNAQTGIVSGGGFVWALCGNTGTHDNLHNWLNRITPGNTTIASCNVPTTYSAFGNGAVYSNGTLYSEEVTAGGGDGDWVSIPTSTSGSPCGGAIFESNLGNAPFLGRGSLTMIGSNLYSEVDQISANTSFTSPAAPGTKFVFSQGGGGLVQDGILGSTVVFGASDEMDLDMHASWASSTRATLTATLALSAGSGASNAGECEVGFNTGGGNGMIQLPDGKLAWPVATAGAETVRNWLCIANL